MLSAGILDAGTVKTHMLIGGEDRILFAGETQMLTAVEARMLDTVKEEFHRMLSAGAIKTQMLSAGRLPSVTVTGYVFF